MWPSRQVSTHVPVGAAGGAAVCRGQGPEDAHNGHTVTRLAAVHQVRLQHNLHCRTWGGIQTKVLGTKSFVVHAGVTDCRTCRRCMWAQVIQQE
jgi:hypothetical protein